MFSLTLPVITRTFAQWQHFPLPCVSSVSMKGVSRAHPHGCGALTGGSLAPAALRTNTHHLWWVAVWEEEGLTGPKRRQRRTRRMCGWTSASPTPQASPPTWTAGMIPSSLVGQQLKSMIQSAWIVTHFFLSWLCTYCMLESKWNIDYEVKVLVFAFIFNVLTFILSEQCRNCCPVIVSLFFPKNAKDSLIKRERAPSKNKLRATIDPLSLQSSTHQVQHTHIIV